MIRLLVIDDHSVVRQGVRQILAGTPDIVVGADATNAADGLAQARADRWDAILLDLNLPDGDGLDVLKQLRKEQAQVPILVLSMHSEDQFSLRAIRAGASGYVTKNGAADELVTAIRTIVDGRHYLSPWLAERLAREATGDASKAPHEQLSDREYQIFRMVVLGKTITQIADELCLSIKTVSTYRARVLDKMEMTSNAELTSYALHNQLIG